MDNHIQSNGEKWAFEGEEAAVVDDHYENGNGYDGVVLGLDGGTTSTVCVCMPFLPFSQALSNPPPILARAVAGCSNHNSVGESSARDTLEDVMAEALSLSNSNKSAVRAVCLGISGVNHPTDQERIINWLRKIFPSHVKLYVQNDAVAALASGTMGKLRGCVLIAGTGCIAYGITEDGREARASGVGPILGDWGSGYGIAAQALTAVIRAHDGRGPQTILTDKILKALDLSSPDELIGWTYRDPSWARIAALVPEVVSCAEASDQVANKILLKAVEELALSVKAVVQRLGLCGEDLLPAILTALELTYAFTKEKAILIAFMHASFTYFDGLHLEDEFSVADGNGSFPVVMVGGVLEANKVWDIGKEVVKCIQELFPGAFPVRPQVEPAVGAALLAWNFFMKESRANYHC